VFDIMLRLVLLLVAAAAATFLLLPPKKSWNFGTSQLEGSRPIHRQ
jgi:hypothetical protein